jgi:tellurite methyltransferase
VSSLAEQFGEIDIYLFDQLLKGRINERDRVLDAGCGSGRNLVFLLRSGYDVSAVDPNPYAIDEVKGLARTLAPSVDVSRFRVEPVEAMTFLDGEFTVVISSAVLHFARDDEHFAGMLKGMWRVLAGGGVLFCRLASTIGIEDRIRALGHSRFSLPDGSERYLVDEAGLME